MEGIPDHHEAFAVTGGRSGWSRRVFAPSDPFQTFQKKEGRRDGSTREGA
jgi:hypothetical protein